ncbi:MAG: hypothetical protein AAF415_13640 [Pseudomonadota bacterium]
MHTNIDAAKIEDGAIQTDPEGANAGGGLQLPLKNMEFTIQQYLLDHGLRLDCETRYLLAQLRDGLSGIAEQTGLLEALEAEAAEPDQAGATRERAA